MQPPVLSAAAAGAPRLIFPGERGDDVVRPAKLGQRELDAGAGGLLGPEEDELVLVREDHWWPQASQEVIAGLLRATSLAHKISAKNGEAKRANPSQSDAAKNAWE